MTPAATVLLHLIAERQRTHINVVKRGDYVFIGFVILSVCLYVPVVPNLFWIVTQNRHPEGGRYPTSDFQQTVQEQVKHFY